MEVLAHARGAVLEQATAVVVPYIAWYGAGNQDASS